MLEQPYFGHRLKRLRLARGLSQAGLVGDGMSTSYLSRLESGERRPTEHAVSYLADRLGVDPSALTGPADGRSLTEVLAAMASAPPGTDDTAALSRAVEEDAGEDPAARWHALWLLARAAGRDGDYEGERVRLHELVELSDVLAAPDLRARSRVRYARCARTLGDLRTAQPAAAQALSIARAAALSVSDTLAALTVLIGVETDLGRLEAAGRYVEDMERDLLPRAAPAQAAEALWTAAGVSSRQGDDAAAEARLDRALNLLRGEDDLLLWTRLRIATSAAALAMSPPRLAAAERRLAEAACVVDVIGTPVQLQELRALQAQLAFHQGRLDEAHALTRALLREQDLRLPFGDRIRLSVLDSRLMILAGHADEGIAALRRLGAQATRSGNLDLAAHVWQALATTLADVRSAGPVPGHDRPGPGG
jgi:transcriptional regulator with XRE-family HTH domain